MKHLLFRPALYILMILCGNHNGFSQVQADSTQNAAAESSLAEDTVIREVRFQLDADSINSYKRSREFAYINYLDSLLKNSHDLKADTVHIGNAVPVKNGSRQSEPKEAPDFRRDNSFLNGPLVRTIFWILAIAFICFILYRLFLADGFFRKNKVMRPAAVEEEEGISADPSSYDRLINDAFQKGDFRLAIRYLYLQTLQKLTLAGFIQFSPDKTNYEYVREMGSRNLQNEFASITLSYEYVWYGEFTVNEHQYNRIKNEYTQFYQKI